MPLVALPCSSSKPIIYQDRLGTDARKRFLQKGCDGLISTGLQGLNYRPQAPDHAAAGLETAAGAEHNRFNRVNPNLTLTQFLDVCSEPVLANHLKKEEEENGMLLLKRRGCVFLPLCRRRVL